MRTKFVASLGLLAVAGCSLSIETDQAVNTPRAEDRPWRLEAANVDTTDGISVLVLHDMEGLSGQDDWRTFSSAYPELYARGQELLAADINAVVDGLFAGGATAVTVVDGHGSGSPDPDLRPDLLDPRATQLFREESFDTYFDVPETESFDAVAVVGMHAKTGSAGFASHTFTLGIEFRIHGQAITETELVGLSWGRFDVPVIFASGDDRLAADLATMPWIESVVVKTATSASTAELRPVREARADLTAAAQRAVENLDTMQIMKVAQPVRATLRAVPPAGLSLLADVPDVDYDAETDSVSFEVDSLRAAYDGLVAWVGVARGAYSGVLQEQLAAAGISGEMSASYRQALFERWLDFESGRWEQPASPVVTGDDETPRFHGYR